MLKKLNFNMNNSISEKRQSIFYNQIVALGFDKEAMTKEHKISFDKKMFCLPNQKAFEVVTNFLFSKMSAVSEKNYDLIWPLVDYKDRKHFQKSCFIHLSNIAQESEIKFPIVTHSVLSSYGDAFYKLYLAFSTHVIFLTNKKYDTPMLKRAKYNPRFYEKYVEILKIHTMSSVEKFQKITDMTSSHLEAYFATAKNLVSDIDKLKHSITTGEASLEEKVKEVSLLVEIKDPSQSQTTVEKMVRENRKYQEKVEELWKCLEKFFMKEDKLWNYLSSELDEDMVKLVLSGKEFNFTVPESLKKEFSEQNQANLVEGGTILNIPRFLKMFNLILNICLKSIKEGNFSETYAFQLLKNNASELKNCFDALRSLNVLAADMTVEDKKEVENLLEDLSLKNSVIEERLFTQTEFADEIPPRGGLESKSYEQQSSFDFEDLLEQKNNEVKTEKGKSCVLTSEMIVEDKAENLFEDLSLKNSVIDQKDFSGDMSPPGIDSKNYEKHKSFDFKGLLEHKKYEVKAEEDKSCYESISLDHKPKFCEPNISFGNSQFLSTDENAFSCMQYSDKKTVPPLSSKSHLPGASCSENTEESRNKISDSVFHSCESWLLEESLSSQTLPPQVFSDSD